MVEQIQVATSGAIRRSFLQLEGMLGRVITEAIIAELDMKGISYETESENIVYHRSEVESALFDVLGPKIGGIVFDELCKCCKELQ